MKERFWRMRAAFWYWWHACHWHEAREAWVMAKSLDYVADPKDVWYQTPHEAVTSDISYWEP